MKNFKYCYLLIFLIIGSSLVSCKSKEKKEESNKTVVSDIWKVDFFDDFDTFNPENWQDQRIWVNNEKQSYVPNGEFGTREVSNGSLKLKLINIGQKRSSDNYDKHGNKQPDTEYVSSRIASKNRKEFIKGKWTAKLKLWGRVVKLVCFQLGGFLVHKIMSLLYKKRMKMSAGH